MTVTWVSEALAQCERCAFCGRGWTSCWIPAARRLCAASGSPTTPATCRSITTTCPRQPTGGQANSALHQRNHALSPSALTFPVPHAITPAPAQRRSVESRITPGKSLALRTPIPHPSRNPARAGPQEVRRSLHYIKKHRSLSPSALTFPTPSANTRAPAYRRSGESCITPEKPLTLTLCTHVPHPSLKHTRAGTSRALPHLPLIPYSPCL